VREKLRKMVATKEEIFSLNLPKAFGGWAPPEPAGEAKALPRPTSRYKGPTSKGRKERGGEGMEGKGSGAPHMTFTHDAPGDVVECVHKLNIRSECA